MNKLKTIIEVEIKNINVEDRYYSFEYTIKVNGDIHTEEIYENDHDWADDKQGFKKLLRGGYAVELAMEDFEL